MSTKIYDGKRIKGSALEAYQRLQSIRPMIQKSITKRVKQEMCNQLLSFAGEASIAMELQREPDFKLKLPPSMRDTPEGTQLIQDICERPMQSLSQLFINWAYYMEHGRGAKLGPFGFQLYYAIAAFPTQKATYCIPTYAGGLSELQQEINKLDWLEDYSYWNNTDRPEHITAREWANRKRKWNNILPTGDIQTDGTLFLYSSIDTTWPFGIYLTILEFQEYMKTHRKTHVVQSMLDVVCTDAVQQKPNITPSELIELRSAKLKAYMNKEPAAVALHDNIDSIYPKDYDDCIYALGAFVK